MTNPPKTRVAILGGGLGAMTAAYELTATPELRARYDVTVYCQGWRLGGKGASGRQRDAGDRIEEHGLHAFLGFYENAFSLMKRAYAEWNKSPENPFQTWSDAFKPQRQLSLAESPDENGRWRSGRWDVWNIDVPPLPGTPGDADDSPTPARYLSLLIDWLRAQLEGPTAKTLSPAVPRSQPGLVEGLVDAALEKLHEYGTDPAKRGRHPLLDAAHDIARWLELCPEDHTPDHRDGLLALLDDLKQFIASAKAMDDIGDDLRRLITILEIGCAAARGIVADLLPPGSGGFSGIDGEDFKEWLMRHGLSRELAWSAPIRGLYDLGFAYFQGREGRDNARAAAGVALKVMLSLVLRSKGAPLWKMQAGMGDTIFTPLYEVLARQRGVRFELFRRVQRLKLSPDKNRIAEIEMSRQVDLVDGYDPVFDVKHLPCWPSEPFWDRIVDGKALAAKLREQGLTLESAWCQHEVGRETLREGEHFDKVVLGISLAALEPITEELSRASDSWSRMLSSVKTVQTQALQLWFNRDLAGLGWKDGTTVMTGYAEPFDTWGEMSHLIKRENWKPGEVKAIEYHCSPMRDAEHIPPFTDPTFPKKEHEKVKQRARSWLNRRVGLLWPDATRPDNPDGLDWSVLVDPSGASGEKRLDSQFWRGNIDPTERYVLSVPGSSKHRLAPGASGFENLYLAGDWTVTSLNSGCAEAAIESGMRASQAISGSPKNIYEH